MPPNHHSKIVRLMTNVPSKTGPALKRLSQILHQCEALSRDALEPACRLGCTACCRRMPFVYSFVEGEMIRKFFPDNARKIRAAKSAIEASADIWETSIAAHGISKEPWNGANSLGPDLAWRMTCPMLVDGACLIYPARPVECRGVISTTVCVGEDDPAMRTGPARAIDWMVKICTGMDQKVLGRTASPTPLHKILLPLL